MNLTILEILTLILLIGFQISTSFGESNSENIDKNIPIVTLNPEKVEYGESVLFQYSLPSYEKPDEETFFFYVLNPEGVKIDSTLWFAKQDSEYEFTTYHPVYEIVESGIYSLIFEKGNVMEPTGEIVLTTFFEITTNPPPLVQFERGVNTANVKCNHSFELIIKNDNSPACVKQSTYQKLLDRKWGVRWPTKTD